MWQPVVRKKALHAGVVGAPSQTGTGVDDLSVIGSPFFSASRSYRVEIDSTSETFKWSNDGGGTWEKEDIPIEARVYYELINAESEREGFKIIFDTAAGHTNGDFWDFDTTGNVVNNTELVVSSLIVNAGGAEELIISGEYDKGNEDGLIIYVKTPLEYTDTILHRQGRNLDTGDGGLIYSPEYFRMTSNSNYKYRVNISGVQFYQLYQIRYGQTSATGLFTAFAETYKIAR